MPFNPTETILDNLLARTKAEIDRLRKLLQADVKSNLNKADMAAEVADYIRHESEFWIRRFPQRDIRIIRGLLSQPQESSSGFNAGFVPYPSALEKIGFVYSERNPSGETIYRCTDEMYDAFKRGISNASAAMHCMNYATYEQYLLGLTNIYGIVPYPMAYDIIIDAADAIETEKFDRQRNPFAFAHETLLLDLYTITVDGKAYVHNPAVFNPEELLADINRHLDPHHYDNFLPAAPSFSHPELVSGSRHSGPDPESPASLANYIKFALWHDAVDYESPHKHLAMDLICEHPRFKSDSGLSQEFWEAIKDYEDNIPIWSRLGYSFKEYYLKFGQPDPSTIKPATNFGVYDPSYISSLRRKKPQK